MDLVSIAPRIPAAGETLLGSSFQMHPGGKGANQAVAVARLGYPVQLIGKLGSDMFGERLRTHLQNVGVGVAGVETVDGPSGIAAITVASTGDNCIVVTPGANAAVSPEYVQQHLPLIRSAGMVLAQLEIPLESVERLAEICSQEQIPLMLDPAPARALSGHLLRRVRWFTPNETEAKFYVHFHQNDAVHRNDTDSDASDARVLQETTRSLLAQGPAGILLKLGARGAYLAVGDIELEVKAMAVEVLDTTAAGDAFNGAFAVGLMLGKSLEESARFAVTAASISVTRVGAQPSMPTFAEVSGLLASEL